MYEEEDEERCGKSALNENGTTVMSHIMSRDDVLDVTSYGLEASLIALLFNNDIKNADVYFYAN